jgi:hypothetical protein
MRTAPILGTILCLTVAAGCSQTPQQVGGDAAPAGGATTTSAAAAPTVTASSPAPSSSPSSSSSSSSSPEPTRTSASPSPSKASAPSVIGPNGFGALKLGMTVKQAEATGLVTKFAGTLGEGCSGTAHLRASAKSNVYFGGSLGIEIIDAYPGISTPEGIKIGSSLAALHRTYPEWDNVTADSEQEESGDGRGYAKASSKADYRIVTFKGKVVELTLQYRNQNCYE